MTSLEEAAENKVFYLPDKRQSSTVEFWFRTFVVHVEATSPLSDDVSRVYKRVCAAVVRFLEWHDDFNVVQHFEPLWARLEKVRADMIGEVASVLRSMVMSPEDVDPDTMKICDFEQKRVFVTSPLWRSFLLERCKLIAVGLKSGGTLGIGAFMLALKNLLAEGGVWGVISRWMGSGEVVKVQES